MGQLSDEHQPWYNLGWREAQKDMEQLYAALDSKQREVLDLEAKTTRAIWWAQNLAIMLRRIVRGGLDERRKSQAGNLVQRFGAEMGEEFKHGILREESNELPPTSTT